MLTSVDKDGTLNGPDINLVNNIKKVIDVPLIVSGGIGSLSHIENLFSKTNNYNFAIGAALHKKIIKIEQIKNFLKLNNFQINR